MEWLDRSHWRPARRQAALLAALTAAVAVAHLAGIAMTTGLSGPMVQGDARAYFAYLPSLVLDHDLDLRNQFDVLQPEHDGDPRFPYGVGRDGLAANPFPVGPALLWLPGYAAGLAVDALLGTRGPTGYGIGAVWGTVIWCLLLVGAGAEAGRRLASGLVGEEPTVAAAVMAWLGTPALYYTLVTPLYSHAVAWFAASLCLWLTWRALATSSRPGPWLAAGVAGGLLVAIRLQDAVLLAVPLLALVTLARQARARRELAGAGAAWLAGVGLGYLPQALVWNRLHGGWLPIQELDGPSGPGLAKLASILLSTGYQGWISWTPLVLPALVGVGLLALRGRSQIVRRMAAGGLVAVAGLILVDLVHPYGPGAAYGGRRYLSATPLLVVGLAALLARRGRAGVPTDAGTARSLLQPRPMELALGALTAWNLWLLISYELLILRHGVYPTLAETARHALGLGAP